MNEPASKVKFVREYAINASPKILYPYLSTASGLARWFADNVNVLGNNVYNIIWDKEDHFAELTNLRSNRSVRLVFLGENKQPVADADYVDFTLETSELTGEQFLRVIDYSSEQDEEEMEELWGNLILSLREIIGG
ncbi:ATPase [Adhaeribacter sp. BT258]|uniref:ATPase n=1 Tax=Adhaeribacter terrigena TaxID=2793070 RepID=A0ABS1C105_9BACT|nr:START-like domain-containing protein [Adhaeribacter terrigena]MBK0402861.1 ATPase [Adhaeribacter terrigena]